MKPLIIGTRGSPLARAQVEIIRALLRQANPALPVEVKIIKTTGDNLVDVSLSAAGGKGLFTKEIEEHLLAGEIHVAVHSLKDLPTILPEGLTIGAVPAREDARDVFLSKKYRSLDELPTGARVATGSVRRRAQLLARRPDLRIEEVRGNVGTRLEKLPNFDGMILAAAGLKRLGLDVTYQPLDVSVMIPAVGQGAIACEVRENDFATQEALAVINDAGTLACVEAERVFLRVLGGGCQVPYAANATIEGNELRLLGAVFEPRLRKTEVRGPKSDPLSVGERAANEIKG